MAGYLNVQHEQSTLDTLNREIHDEYSLRTAAEEEFLAFQISNAERLKAKKLEIYKQEIAKKAGIDLEMASNTRILEIEAKTEIKRQEYIKKAVAKYEKKHAGEIPAEEKEAIEKKAIAKYKIEQSVLNKLAKNEARAEKYRSASSTAAGAFAKGKTLSERVNALSDGISKAGWGALVGAIASLSQQLDGTVESIASSQSAVDTRLQGWGGRTKKTATGGNSYWSAMSSNVLKNIGGSALIKQETVANNIKSLVGRGIAFNVEQRALMESLSEKIAPTFSATSATLLKLVRIQQEDSTAARLGMESALTAFLNNMYETTEYMSEMAEGIRSNIYEASALMTAKSATEFEYQVQKWMGSLYSVGFSQTSGLSGALGKLAAGDISGITSGGYSNLLVMAANKANLSVSDILAKGLDASETNKLMSAMVAYLAGIYSQTKGSNVLAQQYASVFGLSASDLRAAASLNSSNSAVSSSNLSYGGMFSRLTSMANTMGQRTSMGELMSNAWANAMYGTASGIANNPALYAINKVATLLKDTTGGINFSIPLYMGTGTAQTFNIADIMKVAALSGGILSNLGAMFGGLTSSGSGILEKFGVKQGTTVTRGGGAGPLIETGTTTSESGYTANSDSSAITNKAMTDTTDEENQKVQAAGEDEADINDVNDNLVKIYTLLEEVTTGSKRMHVDIDDTFTWIKDAAGGVTGGSFGTF